MIRGAHPLLIAALVVVVIFGLIYEYNKWQDCNSKGGIVVKDAYGNHQCVKGLTP